MSVLPPSGKTPERRPSLKGSLMQDVSNGAERTRAWPRKRGKSLHPKTKEQMEWFRQAQWATKYMDPKQMVIFSEMTKGTPLLPRDIATMMMAGRLFRFIVEDGRKIYSVQSQNDVSDSLDALSQTIGTTLIRTPEGWRGQPPPSGAAFGAIINQVGGLFSAGNALQQINNWGAPSIDQRAYWDPLNPQKFTIPEDAWYLTTLNIVKDASAPDCFGDAFIFRNGVEACADRRWIPASYAGMRFTVTELNYLLAGDEIDYRVVSYGPAGWWTSGSAVIVSLGG
ncbi:MAG: hypothetical protein ACRCYS_02290 [Beijerinckiaceae bacterium]